MKYDEGARETASLGHDKIREDDMLQIRGVELDDGRSMEEVYGDGMGFYRSLVKANACSNVRSKTNDWHSKLQFLTPVIEPACSPDYGLTSHGIDPAETMECCCRLNGYPPFTGSEQLRLRLTRANEIVSCPHYIAVSHCWKTWSKEDDDPLCEIITSNGTRENRTSARLLKWAMDYAAFRGISFIWIDQECIEQTDEAEKQGHINDMDRIFRRAWKVIAPLTTTIRNAEYLKIAELFIEEGKRDARNVEEARDFADLLASDEWFGRAWTLQENISAAQDVDMLVPIEIPNMQLPTWSSIFILGDFAVTSSRRCWRLSSVGWKTFDKASTGLRRDAMHRFLPMKWIHGGDFRECHRVRSDGFYEPIYTRQPRFNAAQSLKALASKGIKLPEGRLSIIANMSEYSARIHLAKSRALELSIGTCVFAQSLLNGDMSLILSYRHYLDPNRRASSLDWTACQVSLSSAIGISSSESSAFGYPPVSLTPEGIQVRGQLWLKRYRIDFPRLLEKHSPTELPIEAADWISFANLTPFTFLQRVKDWLLEDAKHIPRKVVLLAMALAIDNYMLSQLRADKRLPGVLSELLEEPVDRHMDIPSEIIMDLCPLMDPSISVQRIKAAFIEVYVPEQVDYLHAGSLIFWNSNVEEAPEALLTIRKTRLDPDSFHDPLLAWAVRSKFDEESSELYLQSPLPFEIYSDTRKSGNGKETSTDRRRLNFFHADSDQSICWKEKFDSYNAAPLDADWPKKYLLTWQ